MRRPRRRTVAVAGLVVLATSGAAVVVLTLGGNSAPRAASLDNGSPTSLATVTRGTLTSQKLVSATLSYADASTIVQPAGTAPSALLQAQQAVEGDQASLASAQATLTSDEQALARAQATRAADRTKLAIDCRGAGAAATASASAGPCATDAQTVATDDQAVIDGQTKVASDRRSVASAQTALAGAAAALRAAESSAASYDTSSSYTFLPAVGDVVRRGGELYAIDGNPVLLLYGPVSVWRAFRPGMSPGRDVAQLNANLAALGYAPGLGGDAFTGGTAAGIRALQAAHGLNQTGELLLGSVVFEPGAIRVTSVTPTRGQAVQAGAVLGITSTRRVVSIALDAAQQSEVKVGDPVTITLPDNSTTPGRVSKVGTVATTPASDSSGSGSSTPTVTVEVTPTHPTATGRLDQAPVNVSIVTGTARDALIVPVSALLALGGGGYAVEVVGVTGVHRLVAVQLGLFDDQDGLVQVTGHLRPGQRVVVPGT